MHRSCAKQGANTDRPPARVDRSGHHRPLAKIPVLHLRRRPFRRPISGRSRRKRVPRSRPPRIDPQVSCAPRTQASAAAPADTLAARVKRFIDLIRGSSAGQGGESAVSQIVACRTGEEVPSVKGGSERRVQRKAEREVRATDWVAEPTSPGRAPQNQGTIRCSRSVHLSHAEPWRKRRA